MVGSGAFERQHLSEQVKVLLKSRFIGMVFPKPSNSMVNLSKENFPTFAQ